VTPEQKDAEQMCLAFNFLYMDAFNVLGLKDGEACKLAHYEISNAHHVITEKEPCNLIHIGDGLTMGTGFTGTTKNIKMTWVK